MPLRRLESDAEDRCRYEISRRNHSPLHRFPSLGSKSRITARWRAFPGESLQRLPNSPPQIKNHCTLEDVSRQNHAVILKFTPSNQESLQSQGQNSDNPCSDSHIHPMKSGIAATTTAIGGTSLLCDNGNKNRTRKIVAATPAAGETILLCSYKN